MEFTDSSFPFNAYILNDSGAILAPAPAPGIPAVPQHHHHSAHPLPVQVTSSQATQQNGTVFDRLAILAEIDELAKFLPPIRLFPDENPTTDEALIMSGTRQRRSTQRPQKPCATQPTDAACTWTQTTDRLAILEEIDQLASSLPPIRILSVDNSTALPDPIASGLSRFRVDSDRQYKNPSRPKMQKPRKPHGKHRSEEERIQLLQNDDFVESFGESWVICSGCRSKIQLEKRKQVRYYPRAFLVHRQLCKKRMIAEKSREEEGMQVDH